MDRKNYFEMTGLLFDPPEKSEGRIKEAISRWKINTQNLLGSADSEIEKQKLKDELSLETDMLATLLNTKQRNAEANSYKEQKVKQLESLIDILKIGIEGDLEVTRGQISNLHRKLRLQEETVKKVYEKKGYSIQKPPKRLNLSEYFMNTATFNGINKQVQLFKKDTTGAYPWCSKIEDLYDVACFLNGDKDSDRPLYHKRRTKELFDIMNKWSIDLASDMSTTGHLLNGLLTAGTGQVFNSEDNRKKYDRTFDKDKLSNFFTLLKAAPEDFKRDENFAENCIAIIQKSGFPDYNLALAMYNQEAGIIREPYEPIEAYIHITCICKTPYQFRTRQEAQKAKCMTCGRSLYIKCPNKECGKIVPISADRCPFCNFNIFEIQFYDDYISAAELALKNMDFAEAWKQLESARKADPNNSRTEALKQKIEKEEKNFKAPLEELQSLISTGKFLEAKVKADSLTATMPKLNLTRQRKIISDKLTEVGRRMPSTADVSSAAGNICWDILQTVKDYKPAIEKLQKIQLQTPTNLQTSVISNKGLRCSLSWKPTSDVGVTYHIVRKVNGFPTGPLDGEVLADKLQPVTYIDSRLQPGLSYGYGVFAERKGLFSKGAMAEVVYYSELDPESLQYSCSNSSFSVRWTGLPANCIGVRVIKGESYIPPETPSGSSIAIENLATSGFEDRNVQNGKNYGYRLQCVYRYKNGFRYSKGTTYFQKIEPMPDPLKNISVKAQGTKIEAKWSGDNRNQMVLIREIEDSKVVGIPIGTPLRTADSERLFGNGLIYNTTTSDKGKAVFTIPENMSVQVAFISISGQNMIVSAIERLSSVAVCTIDKDKTQIVANELRLYIDIPAKLSAIHYKVATKNGTIVPWCSVKDAEFGLMHRISVADYVADGNIVASNIPPMDIYITVIGEYNFGNQKVFSEPSKYKMSNKPRDLIRYSMSWQTRFFSRVPRNCILTISSKASFLPEMFLCCKNDGTEPMMLDDPDVKVLYTIEELEDGLPNKSVSLSLPDTLWEGIARGTVLRLLLDADDILGYELSANNINNLTVP